MHSYGWISLDRPRTTGRFPQQQIEAVNLITTTINIRARVSSTGIYLFGSNRHWLLPLLWIDRRWYRLDPLSTGLLFN